MSTSTIQQESVQPLDLAWVRAQFPSLKQTVNGHAAAYLDGPAGTQVPQRVIDAVRDYYEQSNANTCGAFATSRRSDAIIASARAAMADFFNCAPDELYFGPNMTTLTFALARAIGRELQPGDEIIVTTLDHDANVAPWRALEERGFVIRQVDIREADCTLDMDDFRRKITKRTRLVAAGFASNAVGTINPVEEIVHLAHDAGALAFIDAVHSAPHCPIDVRSLDCDFLACSPYKFFGPHTGCIYGKREHLLRFHPYKVRPATDALPDRWETGTQTHELIAGIAAAVDYLADLGRHASAGQLGDRSLPAGAHGFSSDKRQINNVRALAPEGDLSRREALLAAYHAIRRHEMSLATRLVEGLLEIPGLRFFGISDPGRFADRVPTVAVRFAKHTPLEAATFLGERGIFTWDGNYYALNLTERLGVEKDGGFLRIGIVHYNSREEIERLLSALHELVGRC
ncbi:MAG TPA: aminotransferase class V-fold PLP-dependent enzyme [Candidatus Acidoferrum sp.]|nr:aminotransferase class V-fold PLP-dependent enzyme [Candidatus Acidoferrum sp.]